LQLFINGKGERALVFGYSQWSLNWWNKRVKSSS
jgi:hypothetical protein